MRRRSLQELPLSYPEVGATRGPLPGDYHHLVRHRTVGTGATTFRAAAEQLMSWDLHRRAGLSVAPTTPSAVPGARVLLGLGRGPLTLRFGCEVVYVLAEPRRRGFAYGTLEGHPERGEELFALEWRTDDTVVLTITAFSRPATWWARAAAPLSRAVQRRITRRYLHAL